MSALRRAVERGQWIQPAPESLPDVSIRACNGGYLIAAYGGDDEGHGGPDDTAILAACSRLLGREVRWASGSCWDATNEAAAGEVVRRAEVSDHG